MSFPDLLYRVAHDYPGAVPALAVRMGKNKTVLQHKLNPNCSTHCINSTEIEQMLDFADANRAAAEYFADKAGCLVIQMMPVVSSDMELLDCFMSVVKELGEFSAEFQRDWSDGEIDRKEFKRLKEKTHATMGRMAEMLERISAMVTDKKVRAAA